MKIQYIVKIVKELTVMSEENNQVWNMMEDMNCMMFGFCKKRHLKDLNLKEKKKND